MEKRKRCCCDRQLHHKKTGEGYGEKGRQNKRKGIFSLVSFIFLWLFCRYHSSQYYVENEMAAETIKELEGLNNLTAGDFKNVYQQIQFDDNIQYEERDFIEMLKRELKFKKDLSPKKGKIGFCA